MRKIKLLILLFIISFTSCEVNDVNEITETQELKVTKDVLLQIRNLGYSDNGVKIFETQNGISYIVENDILVTEEELKKGSDSGNILLNSDSKQYRTTLVPSYGRVGCRDYCLSTIRIKIDPSLPSSYLTALENAAARYNSIPNRAYYVEAQLDTDPTSIRNITIQSGNLPSGVFAAAGFPTGETKYRDREQTQPYTYVSAYPTIIMNPTTINTNNMGFLTTLIAHEIGHCIGFRHTDWFNRSFSGCAPGNEGQSEYGAVHIPGTPTTEEAGSWMLACSSRTTNRPFTANDVTAILAVHGR